MSIETNKGSFNEVRRYETSSSLEVLILGKKKKRSVIFFDDKFPERNRAKGKFDSFFHMTPECDKKHITRVIYFRSRVCVRQSGEYSARVLLDLNTITRGYCKKYTRPRSRDCTQMVGPYACDTIAGISISPN